MPSMNIKTFILVMKMIEESKALLAKENLSDKAKYIVSHKIDTLSKIN